MMTLMKNLVDFIARNVLLLCLVTLTACAEVPRERVFDEFILVKTEDSDSLAAFASEYLNDAEKDWQIAQFNHITALSPGQDLIIPLRPFEWGGIRQDGYQVVPVLTYYGFSRENTGKRIVSEAAFKAQMKFLKVKGYRVISLDQLVDFLEFKVQIPEKSVAITFDNGWRSVYDIALPILKTHGYPATLFVRTDFIGKKNAMSWDQVGLLTENGFDIQCKTVTNPDMSRLKDAASFMATFRAIQKEITQSKKIVKNKLNRECRYLAYACGKTNNIVIALLKKEGFRAAFTMQRGSNPFFVNNYMIHRSVIHGGFDMGQFKKNLSVFIPDTVDSSGH